MSAPTPTEVDKKAAQYYALTAALDEATEQAKLRTIPLCQLKTELVELVSAYGSCHAAKSKILHGVSEEMVAIFGQSVTVDAAAVERFRLALVESNQSRGARGRDHHQKREIIDRTSVAVFPVSGGEAEEPYPTGEGKVNCTIDSAA